MTLGADGPRLLVVPPQADFTLVVRPPPGFDTLDLGRAFVARLCTPATLDAAEGALLTASDGQRLLWLRSARALLAAAGAEPWPHLRSVGALLAAVSGPPSGVRLRADDLELAQGTTERSQDVLAAAAADAPYRPELDACAQRAQDAAEVRIWLEQDQQLPATAYLASTLDGVPLSVSGRFARLHWPTLSRLRPFHRAQLAQDDLDVQLAGAPGCLAPKPLAWHTRDDQEPGGPWGGRCAWKAVLAPEALARSRCQVAVVAFCSAAGDLVADDGASHPMEAVARAAETLRGAGVRTVAEWWVGAPGVGVEALEQTWKRLTQALPFDVLAGVRRFGWPVDDGRTTFGAVALSLGSPPADRDLARTRPFAAPGTLDASESLAQTQSLAARAAAAFAVAPGRLAQAYASAAPPARPAALALDPDCAVVPLPWSLDGQPAQTWYAANLRTGGMLKLDARLGPNLSQRPVGDALLSGVPAGQRERLVSALVDKRVLVRS